MTHLLHRSSHSKKQLDLLRHSGTLHTRNSSNFNSDSWWLQRSSEGQPNFHTPT